MSQGIPKVFKIGFAKYRRDMVAQALSRMLSQFRVSPVYREFVEMLVRIGPQWVYDEILKEQESRTLYHAAGDKLEIIGRIVGQPRIPHSFDDSRWFCFDRQGQGFDQESFWVFGAPMVGEAPAADPQYRMLILARIACNFCRFSSRPELAYLAKFVTGETVSWQRVGPMESMILVSSNISRTNFEILTKFSTTTAADDIPMIPYPATLNLSKAAFLPEMPFIFDRGDGHQFDAGKFAVAVDV